MTPEWVDCLGAFSAAVGAVLAGVALWFAVKAGRDLTHDRRDTFELQVFREMYEIISNGQHATRYLLEFLIGIFPGVSEYYIEHDRLGWEAEHGPHTRPGYASEAQYRPWRSSELDRTQNNALRELLTAAAHRPGDGQ